jgi:spermidine synthase
MLARMDYSCDSAYHHMTVTDVGPLRVLQFERNRQSTMYLDAPFDTDFEYPSYLHLTIAFQPEARRTLVIGLGGGTVVKRMWRDYPEMRLDVAELDPAVVDIARRFFALPVDERIRVHVEDGRSFLESSAESYDIVIVDAFDDDRVPRPLTTEEFMRTVHGRLAPDGVVAYNVIGSLTGDKSRHFRSLYRTLANVWREVWVFRVDDGVEAEGCNIILLATDEVVHSDELRARIKGRVDGRVTVPAFDRFGDDLFTGPIRSGDVPIIVDPPEPKRRG